MSKRSGNALGILFILIGIASCGAGYQMQSATVFIAGLVVFGVAAYLLDPSSMKVAVRGFAKDGTGLVSLGRRSYDGEIDEPKPRKHNRKESEGGD